MRIGQLGDSGLTTTVLGFGCAAIMGRTGYRASKNALAAAWDEGVTFYDTARSYGYGESEAVLGQFLRGRRDRAIISTKFGILASPQALWKRVVKPAVRALLSAVPSARGAIQKRTAAEFTANQFTVANLEQSLNQSLCKLNTDYVDILFMHEALQSVLVQDDLLNALEKLVTAGKVRLVGISGTPSIAEAATQKQPKPLRAAQFPLNILDFSAISTAAAVDKAGWVGVANQPFGGVAGVRQCRALLGDLVASAPAQLRAKLAGVNDSILSDAVINLILSTPGIHVVIPAMMNLTHIRDNVNAVTHSRFSTADLDWLRASIAARLSPTDSTGVCSPGPV
jgi:aryl-alcohol dehydrogenase-like predicted oxidoreductase